MTDSISGRSEGSLPPRIGVFDSGLGGLTVLRALIDLLPRCETVYFGDTGRFPYGPKPASEVRRYAHETRLARMGQRWHGCPAQ